MLCICVKTSEHLAMGVKTVEHMTVQTGEHLSVGVKTGEHM